MREAFSFRIATVLPTKYDTVLPRRWAPTT